MHVYDDRYAAHDAVALRVDGKEPAAGSGLLDRWTIAQQPREGDQKRSRVRAANSEPGVECCFGVVARGRRRVAAGLADDNAAGSLDRFSEDDVVARQRGELLARLFVESAPTRTTGPMISGVVRMLKAEKRRRTGNPSWTWSISFGSTLASTMSVSDSGTISMTGSPAVITPVTSSARPPIMEPAMIMPGVDS